MLLRFYEFLKIPEGRRVPVLKKYWQEAINGLVVRYIQKKKIPLEPLNTQERKEKVIASLTSFPARIDCVEYAVKSLMLQDYRPDRIILWLSKLQFSGDSDLPKSLLAMKEYGLEIMYCEDDLRGHKKYFELMKVQKPDELVITFDDDIIYPHDSITKLMRLHEQYPNAVIANRGYEITFDEGGKRKPHRWWALMSRYGVKEPKKLLHLSNGSGVLYPYSAMYKDVCDATLIKKFALGIDDLWMSVMAILNDTPMIKSTYAHKTFSVYPGSQEVQLGLENMRNEENIDRYDVLLEELIKYYPQLKEKMSINNK